MDERHDGKIIERDINEEMQTAYIDYAMSVIVQRALPEVGTIHMEMPLFMMLW